MRCKCKNITVSIIWDTSPNLNAKRSLHLQLIPHFDWTHNFGTLTRSKCKNVIVHYDFGCHVVETPYQAEEQKVICTHNLLASQIVSSVVGVPPHVTSV